MRVPKNLLFASLVLAGLAACTDTETKYVDRIPDCSPTYPTGQCASGQSCSQGACVATASLCSATNATGSCPNGFQCYGGGCIVAASVPAACSPTVPNGTCDAGQTCFMGACATTASICSAANQAGTCPTGWACYGGGCIIASAVPPVTPAEVDPCAAQVTTTQPTLGFAAAKPTKAGGVAYTYDADNNTATAAVEVPYTQKAKITVDGKDFRDLNHNTTLERYEDWRYSPLCRARDLVKRMTVPQKVGLMNSGGSLGNGSNDGVLADSTVQNIAYWNYRQGLTRFGFTGTQLATYFNNVQAMAEGLPLGIPAIVSADPAHSISASMAADGTMSISKSTLMTNWPSTLAFGAINDRDLTRRHGDCVRREFMAAGLRWQLGPMADSATEPRWGRIAGVLGSDPVAVSKHVEAMVIGFQGSATGDLRNGIAATMKHFPGHGAEDDGMDAHTYPGRFNVYPGNNLEAHFIPFQAAFDVGAAAIMPCYAIYKDQYQYDPLQIPSGFSYEFITGLAKKRMGFTGMVTGDWNTANGQAFNMENWTYAERGAQWLHAGSHQFGIDSNTAFQQAFDQGLVSEAEIDAAAEKILEMTFKTGAFENPYVVAANAATSMRTQADRRDGFETMKKAIVLLRNQDHATSSIRYLPINGTRYTDKAGGTASAPDVGEFHCDTNGDAKVTVYYDGVFDSIVGPTAAEAAKQDDVNDLFGDYNYTAAGSGTAGVAGYTLPVEATADITKADIAIIRIVPRASARTFEGLLSYDGVLTPDQLVNQVDGSLAAAAASKKKVLDAFRARDGYKKSDGTQVLPTNATLKIILVQQTTRPGIVRPFIVGLVSLDELAGQAGSYPSVSDEANINQLATFTGVDAFLADFGAYDRAVLDFVFNKNVPTGFTYGSARLPMELPSSDAAVRGQLEDVANDSWQPSYINGAGIALPAN
ncbi:MAG: glycoside hydrolase family 3 N-terminal domain-containing protein [Anaeromyxobacteraceae bacterium]